MMQGQIEMNWDSYSDHLKEMMHNLMNSNETADVTIVCDDKSKFKVHKFVLIASSSVFQSIIKDLSKNGDSVIYLRGVLAEDMKSILQFLYLGQATLHEERMNEFLSVAQSLEIKDLYKDEKPDNVDTTQFVYDELTNSSSVAASLEIKDICKDEKPNDFDTAQFVYDELALSSSEDWDEKDQNFNQSIKEEKKHESSKNIKAKKRKNFVEDSMKDLGPYPCNKCDKKFALKSSLYHHKKRIHDGIRYSCHICGKLFAQNNYLSTHIRSVHEGKVFPCKVCGLHAKSQGALRNHKNNKH